jgi:YebC/PmpR family DNA-binding regulatory protein
MAGHSQFKNIMHRKNAQDAKKAKRFSKLLREISVAVRAGGGDPEFNARLRIALLNARQANVPKDTIERAMKNTSDEQYETLYYEGFGPGNVAFLVEVLTSNRNKSACDIRTLFNKNSGRLADTRFLFFPAGVIVYDCNEAPKDQLVETAIDHGAIDMCEDQSYCTLICDRENFWALKDVLEKTFAAPSQAYITWRPHVFIELEKNQEEGFKKFFSALDDCEDIQNIWCNTQLHLDDA